MAKLSATQLRVLCQVANRNGFFSAWSLGTRTCEALRVRGLVTNSYGDRPFIGGWDRDNGQVWITDAGRAAIAATPRKEG